MAAQPGENDPVLMAYIDTVSQIKSFKLQFHNTHAIHDTEKLPIHVKIDFGSPTLPN